MSKRSEQLTAELAAERARSKRLRETVTALSQILSKSDIPIHAKIAVLRLTRIALDIP